MKRHWLIVVFDACAALYFGRLRPLPRVIGALPLWERLERPKWRRSRQCKGDSPRIAITGRCTRQRPRLEGTFSVLELKAAPYRLTVEATGFRACDN